MNKIIRFGMVFDEGSVPDFGGICQTRSGDFTCPADDVSKLNRALTRTVCAPLMTGGCFPVQSGDLAFVPEEKAVYMYEASGDEWHEVIADDEEE